MKYFILILLCAFALTEAQPRRNFKVADLEVHFFPSSNGFQTYLLYKIGYDKLVFEKNGNSFKAGFGIEISVKDEDSNFVFRDFKEDNIRVNGFDETIHKQKFHTGFIKFDLSEGEYKILPILKDLNSDGSMQFHPISVNLNEKNKYLKPVLVKPDFEVLIVNNTLPFMHDPFRIIIPSLKEDDIELILEKNDETLLTASPDSSFYSNGEFNSENGKIFYSENSGEEIINYVFNGIGSRLIESDIKLKVISKDSDEKVSEEFQYKVEWLNKPFSLRDTEKAIELIELVEADSVVDKVFNSEDDDLDRSLYNYWKEFDPTPETEFNELMAEFYYRVDYAIINFGSIDVRNGVSTDRGKVYVRFGEPDKIERSTDDFGRVMEKWEYNKQEQTFVFIDKRGTGNFLLISG